DMFLYTGDDLDPIAKKVAATIKKDDKKVSLGDKIDKSELLTDQHDEEHEEHEEHGHNHEHEHHHGGYDHHVWLDTKFNQVLAKKIKNKIIKQDPKHKS